MRLWQLCCCLVLPVRSEFGRSEGSVKLLNQTSSDSRAEYAASFKQPTCAFVTLITEASCKKMQYVAGTLTLVQSLLSTGTKRDIIVVIADNIADREKIAAHFEVFGTEQVKVRFQQKKFTQKKGFMPLADRWRGMLMKFEFWNPASSVTGGYDKLVYYDADHLILRNVDNVCDCGGFSSTPEICGVNDKTQSEKVWNGEYFNAGFLVFSPNIRDYTTLMKTITKNSLTEGKVPPRVLKAPHYTKYAVAYSLFQLHDMWFPEPKADGSYNAKSLFEQDILNVVFRWRVRFLPDGYNAWMKGSGLEKGEELFTDKAEFDMYVKHSLRALHGVLWEQSDWGYKFPSWAREAWASEFSEVVQKLAAAPGRTMVAKELCPANGMIDSCVLCPKEDANCLLKCVSGKGLARRRSRLRS